jgi:hypothetical protein
MNSERTFEKNGIVLQFPDDTRSDADLDAFLDLLLTIARRVEAQTQPEAPFIVPEEAAS